MLGLRGAHRAALPAAAEGSGDRHRLSERHQRRSRPPAISAGRRQRARRQRLPSPCSDDARHRLHRARVTEPRHPPDGRRAGSRYPRLHPLRSGRVTARLRPQAAIDDYFERATMRRLTEHTETDQHSLRKILRTCRARGLRRHSGRDSTTASCRWRCRSSGPHGRIVAAANCSGRDEPARSRR